MWKNSEMPSQFALTLHRWAWLIRLGGQRSVARLFIALFTTVGGGGRVYVILKILLYISRNRQITLRVS